MHYPVVVGAAADGDRRGDDEAPEDPTTARSSLMGAMVRPRDRGASGQIDAGGERTGGSDMLGAALRPARTERPPVELSHALSVESCPAPVDAHRGALFDRRSRVRRGGMVDPRLPAADGSVVAATRPTMGPRPRTTAAPPAPAMTTAGRPRAARSVTPRAGAAWAVSSAATPACWELPRPYGAGVSGGLRRRRRLRRRRHPLRPRVAPLHGLRRRQRLRARDALRRHGNACRLQRGPPVRRGQHLLRRPVRRRQRQRGPLRRLRQRVAPAARAASAAARRPTATR